MTERDSVEARLTTAETPCSGSARLGHRRWHALALLALASCHSPPPTPQTTAVAAPAPPPPASTARGPVWVLGSDPQWSWARQVQGGELQLGRFVMQGEIPSVRGGGRARRIIRDDGEVVMARELLPTRATTVLRTSEGEFLFVGANDQLYRSRTALGPVEAQTETDWPPLLGIVAAGRDHLVTVTRDSDVVFSVDGAASWQRAEGDIAGIPMSLAMNDRGEGLLLSSPQTLWQTKDDGRSFKFLTHGDHPILGLFVGPKGQLQAWSYDDAVMSLDGGSLGPPADQPWRPPSRYQHLLLEEGALALRRTEDDSLEVAFRRAERSSPWTPVKGVGRCRDPHATGYDGRLYLACSDSAPTWLLTSKDDGSKWEALAVGPAPSGRLLDLTAGPEGTLLLTTEEGTAHILAPGAATFAPLLPDVSGAEDPDPSRATPQFEGARRVRSAIVSDEGVHLLVSRSGQCAHALVARSQATPLTETPLPCGDLRREDGAVVLVARTEQEMAAPTIDRWRHEGAQWKSLPSIHPPSYARHLDVGGRHALACTDERPHSHDDYAWESSDDGKTWRAIAAPPRCETIRCTTSACVFNGEDLRLGWADDLPRPKVLAPVGRPPPTESSDSQESGGRLRLRCRREGATKPLGGTDDPAATLQSLAASPLVGAVPWAAVLPRGQSATVVFGGGAAAYHKALLPAGLRFHWVLLRSHGLLTLAQSPTAEMSLHLTPWGAEATSSMIAPQPPGADLDGMVMGGDTQDLALGWTTRAPARVSYLTGRTLHDHLRHMPEELPLWEARQIGGAWFAHSPTRTLIGPPSPTPEDEWLSTSAERAQHLMLGASARVSVGGALLGVSLPRSPTDSPRWRGFVGELAPDGSLGELREVSASAAIHAPPCAIGDVAGVALIFDEEASLELDGESHGSAAVVRVHPDGAICLSSWLAREGTILLPASDLDQGRAFAISPPPASVLSATPLRCERP